MAGIQSPLQLGNAGDIIGSSGLGGGGGGGQPQGAQRHLSPHQFPKMPKLPGEEAAPEAGAAEGAAGAGEAAAGAGALEELAPLLLLA